MSSKWIWAAVASAAVMACAADAADAAVVTADFSGAIGSGVDQTGTFGSAGADLAGRSFDLTFVFDTAKGEVDRPGTRVNWFGGSLVGASSPGSATFTVNGVSVSFSGDALSQWLMTRNDSGGVFAWEDLYVSGDDYGPYVSAEFAPVQAAPYVVGLPFDGDPCVGLPSCDGFFQGSAVGGQSDLLQFKPSHLTITVDGVLPDDLTSIPEPATWALMLAGFVGAGASIRRRQWSRA